MRFRYCLYSDIHGQVPQLEAVERAVAEEKPDKVIVPGDLIGLGPEPDKIVQHFMDRPHIDVIVGNVDLWVANKVDEKLKPKSNHQEWMFRMTRMTRERMTEEQLEWIRKRPFSMTYTPELGHDFHVFHGTPHDIGDNDAFPARVKDEQIAEKLKDDDFDVGAHGHIHGPSVRYLKKPNKTQILVCVAAVGMSWDGDPRPAYAVVDYLGDGKWEARVERVEFDPEEQAKFNENSWIEHGERIASMIRTGNFWNPGHLPH
ncbi:MAG: metallophosphoesterase [Betaproteobacteria bacterium]|nr:MAG: metallophosphoesterase [Betaproteobacteria bacterium]